VYLGRLYLGLASSICALYFAAVFYDATIKKVSQRLSFAAKISIVGASVVLILRTYLILRIYYPSQFRWDGLLGTEMPFILIPTLLFVFIAQFYFLLMFFKENH